MKIGMTSVYVNDPIAAFRFYTEVLGFKKKVFIPEAMLAIVVSPEDPEGTSLLLEPNQHDVAKVYQKGLYEMEIPVMVFTSNDVQRDCDRLAALGVKFNRKPEKTEYGTEALFEDGFGNIIQMFQV
jgi:predicted enzyme related to lactoylglutathione lyase